MKITILITSLVLALLNTANASTIVTTENNGYSYFNTLSLQANPVNTLWSYIEVTYAEPLSTDDVFNINLYGSASDTNSFLSLTHTSDPAVFSFENSISTYAQSWEDLEGYIEIEVLSGSIDIESIYISVTNNVATYDGTFLVTTVPLPASIWLLISGLLVLISSKNITSKST